MIRKKLLIVSLLVVTMSAFSQDRFTEQYSMNLNMNGSFTGNYEKFDTGWLMTTDVSTGVSLFVLQNVFAGVGLNFGETRQSNHTISNTLIGVNAGYACGILEETIFPYISTGIRFAIHHQDEISNLKGPGYIFSGGIIFPLKPHLGINADVSYLMIKQKERLWDDYLSGNDIIFSIGINCLIF